MTLLQSEAPLRLKVAGFRKPLRLRGLGAAGGLETFAIEGERLQAVRLVPIPQAPDLYATALDAFEALGRKLQSAAPRAALPVEAVVRAPSGVFWLQPPAGLTLEAWLMAHPGPVPAPVVAAFARRLAEALSEAHAAGVTHGDLCPRTVLIEDDAVRLTGFAIDRRPFFRALRRQEGLVAPGYAPPEAHDGALRRTIGPAADLYGASALLRRLLTGAAPTPANQAARLAGPDVWPSDLAIPPNLRAGIDAGLALDPDARPATASDWLSGLGLGPETGAWLDGVAGATPPSDTLDLPPAPVEAPLTLVRDTPSRPRTVWWAAGVALVVLGASVLALVAPKLASRPRPPPRAGAPPAVVPVAPGGCQWVASAGAWRLRCADAPPQGLRLPERFDARTTARASTGEPAAMERLGAFYRLRAGERDNGNRSAYAYQALDWLQRAADAPADGRPETARARDDAALALGQMLASGEGGRAPDLTAAESRLRQAAEGSRADAVLSLGRFLEARAGADAARLAEARGLFARVAQLGDGSALQREGERGLARLDAAAAPKAQEAAPPIPPPPPKPIETPIEPKKQPSAATKPVARSMARPQKPPAPTVRTRATPTTAAPPRAAVPPPRPTPRPVLRTWTASTFIRVDPTANFSPALELAGRAACDSEGGEAIAVRAGDTLCPNGVNYCQVRAVATCQGARP